MYNRCRFRVLLLLLLPVFTARAEAQDPPVKLKPIFDSDTGMYGLNFGGLIMGRRGELYGTSGAFANTLGVVYKLTPPAKPGASWVPTILYSFPLSGNGAVVNPGLAMGPDGSLYGTTAFGGATNGGIAFRLTPPASDGDPWTESVIYNFGVQPGDGAAPAAAVTLGPEGVLYGTTSSGGAAAQGTVYQLTPPITSHGPWTETILHSFAGPDGAIPYAPVVIGPKGALYGTTFDGGAAGAAGTVFELDPPLTKEGSWKEQVLHSFSGSPDGRQPSSTVVLGKTGIYGSTPTDGPSGGGIVFKLEQSDSGSWTETILYAFDNTSSSPYKPLGALVIGEGESLFGTANFGGDFTSCSSGCGSVFRLDPPQTGTSWTETNLHTFTGGADGGLPSTGIIFGPDNTAYGTNDGGPTAIYGLVFQLIP